MRVAGKSKRARCLRLAKGGSIQSHPVLSTKCPKPLLTKWFEEDGEGDVEENLLEFVSQREIEDGQIGNFADEEFRLPRKAHSLRQNHAVFITTRSNQRQRHTIASLWGGKIADARVKFSFLSPFHCGPDQPKT